MHVPLGPGREFDRIRAIAERLGSRASGLGDDCVRVPEGDGSLVLSTDTSIEEVHFRRSWLSPEEIGWRAAMAALSDLAAAGATPFGVLAAVTTPDGEGEPERLMGGIGDAVNEFGGVVLGGDLSRGVVLSLTLTVIGRALRPTSRRGGVAGDSLWVTGTLGGPRAAVTQWRAGRTPDPLARQAFARPMARIAGGSWLARHGAHAQIDVSDGLAGDVRHLAAAGGVGVEILLEDLPLHPSVAGAAALVGEAPEAFAAQGGEDFEILAALPGSFGAADARRFRQETGVGLTRIGNLAAGTEVRLLLRGSALELTGFDHFR